MSTTCSLTFSITHWFPLDKYYQASQLSNSKYSNLPEGLFNLSSSNNSNLPKWSKLSKKIQTTLTFQILPKKWRKGKTKILLITLVNIPLCECHCLTEYFAGAICALGFRRSLDIIGHGQTNNSICAEYTFSFFITLSIHKNFWSNFVIAGFNAHCELPRYSVTQKYATATTRTAICDLNQRVSWEISFQMHCTMYGPKERSLPTQYSLF